MQGITRAIIQVASAGAIYAPNKFSAGQKFWQGNDQGKGFFTRAFALACPGVVPPLNIKRTSERLKRRSINDQIHACTSCSRRCFVFFSPRTGGPLDRPTAHLPDSAEGRPRLPRRPGPSPR